MHTYSLNELIKKGISPEIFDNIIIEILNITLPVKDDYPEYKTWFLTKHIESLGIDRDTLFTVYKDKIVGVANIKFSENKICTLYIKQGFRANKIGTELLNHCMEVLGTSKPLITISSNKLSQFKKFIKANEWEYSETLNNYYTPGSDEYVFNGTMYMPKEKEIIKPIQKIIKPNNFYHITLPYTKKFIMFIKHIFKYI